MNVKYLSCLILTFVVGCGASQQHAEVNEMTELQKMVAFEQHANQVIDIQTKEIVPRKQRFKDDVRDMGASIDRENVEYRLACESDVLSPQECNDRMIFVLEISSSYLTHCVSLSEELIRAEKQLLQHLQPVLRTARVALNHSREESPENTQIVATLDRVLHAYDPKHRAVNLAVSLDDLALRSITSSESVRGLEKFRDFAVRLRESVDQAIQDAKRSPNKLRLPSFQKGTLIL